MIEQGMSLEHVSFVEPITYLPLHESRVAAIVAHAQFSSSSLFFQEASDVKVRANVFLFLRRSITYPAGRAGAAGVAFFIARLRLAVRV